MPIARIHKCELKNKKISRKESRSFRENDEGTHVMIGNDNMIMPVAPVGGFGGNGTGFGGDFSSWIILFLIFAMFGNGWGNGFGGGADGGLYPWMNQSNQMSDGFRDQMINSTINGIQTSVTSGFGDVQNSLCAGFAGVNAAINNAQMASLERSFAEQTANAQGFFGVQSAIAQSNYANGYGLADIKYTLANEACASRATSTANTQAILDKLCQLELDNYKTQLENKNDTIAQLRSDLQYARGQASQDVQTAAILAGQTAEVDALYNRLNSCPVSTVPVYGKQPIFTCGSGYNYGCGCGSVA